MKTLVGSTGQNIFDIAFMCYGSYDVLKLMSENPFITDLSYNDFAGKTIQYTPVKNNATFANGLSSGAVNTGNKTISRYLLQENGFYLLQENGFNILL